MSSENINSSPTLSQIENTFKTHRSERTSKNMRFPAELQSLAVMALGNFTEAEVARAAGVVAKSVRNWRDARQKAKKSVAKIKARRLKVVSQRPEPELSFAAQTTCLSSLARITLLSGVVIELLESQLSTGILRELCGLRAQQ